MNGHLVHGIHTPNGDPKVKALIAYIASLFENFYYPDYGWIAALETRRVNPIIVGVMLPYIQPGDIVFCHSNGASVGYDLVKAGAPIGGLVLIDAALRRDIVLPPTVKFCHVYYNAGDEITMLAQAVAQLPLTLVDPNWGDMGHYGPLIADPYTLSITTSIDCAHTQGMMDDEGHSTIFGSPEIEVWGPYIANKVKDAICPIQT